MKKISLVAGGAGFLGSHLCEALLESGRQVVCLDNLRTGSERNISRFQGNPEFEFINWDVRESFERRVDEIYNFASPASPPRYQSDPIFTLETNILGTLNLAKLALANGCCILQASTSEVYGDPLVHPQPEAYWGNVNPIGVRSCYDEGKRAAETVLFDFHRSKGLNIKVARLFNTYGPFMDPEDGRVVSNFVVQALSGKDLTVYGEGGQTRSFCYVSDTITAILALMDSAEEVVGPVNIGNPSEFTVLALAEEVIRLTGSKSGIVRHPLPSDDPTRRKPDIALARSLLSWEPRVSLSQGLEQTIAFFAGNGARERAKN